MISSRYFAPLSAAAAALLLSACASTPGTEDLPRPKFGQWQLTSTDQTGETVTFRDCMDKDTFYKTRQLQQAHRDVQQCITKADKNNSGWLFSANCKVGQTEQRIQTDRTITGDFEKSFHVLSVTNQQMPDGSVVKTTRNIKGEYLGACPAGITPGTRVFEGGQSINFYDITGIAPK